jgi:hydrogenase nickel incorporation protein HypB
MCNECGCGEKGEFKAQAMQELPKKNLRLTEKQTTAPPAGHQHEHTHADGVTHSHGHSHHDIPVHQSLLANNDRLAERNRGYFKGKGLLAINMLSSPGAGKTSLIERTLEALQEGEHSPAAVIVGDLETENDAARIRDKGAAVVQVTTGTVCHLDAEMVATAVERLELKQATLLIIENVGNLVCPASFDLGEDARIVLLSTTEGEDKPLKYAPIFRTADVVVVNKIDIAEAVGFDRDKAMKNIHQAAPQATIIEVSARTGEGLDTWLTFLQKSRQKLLANP